MFRALSLESRVGLMLHNQLQPRGLDRKGVNIDRTVTPRSRSDSLRDLSFAEVSFTSCSIRCLELCLRPFEDNKTKVSNSQSSVGGIGKVGGEYEQLLAVVRGVLGGADGIDEAAESGDCGVYLEDPSSHGLGGALRPRGGRPAAAILHVLEAHLLHSLAGLTEKGFSPV